jgi:dihydroorotase
MKIHIQGGRLIDPAANVDAEQDLYIAAGKIVGVGRAPADFHANKTIDARGMIVCPGLVDLSAACASRATNTRRRWNPNWPPPLPVA